MAAKAALNCASDVRLQPRDQLFGRGDGAASGRRPGRSASSSRAGELAVLLDGERVDRADLRQRPSHAPQLTVQRVVVERGQLGHQLVARRDGSRGGASAGPRRSTAGPAAAANRGRAPAPEPCAARALLDAADASMAAACASRSSVAQLRRLPHLALQRLQQLARSRSRSASAAPRASRGCLVRLTSRGSGRLQLAHARRAESFARGLLRRDGGLRLHPARGLAPRGCARRRADGPRSASGRLCAGQAARRAVALVRGCRPTPVAQRGHLALQRGQRGAAARRRRVASAAGSAPAMAGQLISDARLGGPRSFASRARRPPDRPPRRARRARSPRGCAARPPASRPASVTAAMARAASAAGGGLLLRRSPPAPDRARGGVRDCCAAADPFDSAARGARADRASRPCHRRRSPPASRRAAGATRQAASRRPAAMRSSGTGPALDPHRSIRPTSGRRRRPPAHPRVRRRLVPRPRDLRRPAAAPIHAPRPAARPARSSCHSRACSSSPPTTASIAGHASSGASIPSSRARQPAAARMEPSRPRPSARSWSASSSPRMAPAFSASSDARRRAASAVGCGLHDRGQGSFVRPYGWPPPPQSRWTRLYAATAVTPAPSAASRRTSSSSCSSCSRRASVRADCSSRRATSAMRRPARWRASARRSSAAIRARSSSASASAAACQARFGRRSGRDRARQGVIGTRRGLRRRTLVACTASSASAARIAAAASSRRLVRAVERPTRPEPSASRVAAWRSRCLPRRGIGPPVGLLGLGDRAAVGVGSPNGAPPVPPRLRPRGAAPRPAPALGGPPVDGAPRARAPARGVPSASCSCWCCAWSARRRTCGLSSRDQVADAGQVVARPSQAAERLVLAHLQVLDAGRLLEQLPPLLGAQREGGVDGALPHHHQLVGARDDRRPAGRPRRAAGRARR